MIYALLTLSQQLVRESSPWLNSQIVMKKPLCLLDKEAA